jgi:hypothetical protein
MKTQKKQSVSIARGSGQHEPDVRLESLTNPKADSSGQSRERLALGLLVMVAGAVRWAWIDTWPLWFDEVNTLYRASGEGLTGILARIVADVQAPLYDYVMGLVVSLFGDGLLAARIPPLLAGVLLVPVAAGLAGELGGGRTARLLAAAWVALNPCLVRYGFEARPYSCLALFSGLTLLAALRVVGRRGRSAWPLAVAGTALVMCHYYGVTAYAVILLFLLGSLGALSPRLPSVLAAAAVPLVSLAIWSPVALYQLTRKSMGSIYRSLDSTTALGILDAQGLTAPLTRAGDEPTLLLLGRCLFLLLVALGAISAWRSQQLPRLSGLNAPDGRRAGRRLIIAGVLLALLGLVLPPTSLVSPASYLAKEGRPLDQENIAFLDQVVRLVFAAGAALIFTGLAWPRLSIRASRSVARARPVLLLLAVLVVPLGGVALLAALGRPTLAIRNTLFMAPAVAVLVALGVERLPRLLAALAVLALLVLGGWSMAHMDGYLSRRPWDEAIQVVDASGAEPMAHPPWISRCIEYHGGRPWKSVFGSYSLEQVATWAQGHDAVVLVTGFEQLADPTEVQAALRDRFGPPEITALTGLRCLVYRR